MVNKCLSYKTTFGIINHSLSNCFDLLIENISTVNLESMKFNHHLQLKFLLKRVRKVSSRR